MTSEQAVNAMPVPTTPLHPNQCQNVPARKVPNEPACKIGSHKDGIDSVGSLRIECENCSLITELDTLHTYIYQ